MRKRKRKKPEYPIHWWRYISTMGYSSQWGNTTAQMSCKYLMLGKTFLKTLLTCWMIPLIGHSGKRKTNQCFQELVIEISLASKTEEFSGCWNCSTYISSLFWLHNHRSRFGKPHRSIKDDFLLYKNHTSIFFKWRKWGKWVGISQERRGKVTPGRGNPSCPLGVHRKGIKVREVELKSEGEEWNWWVRSMSKMGL